MSIAGIQLAHSLREQIYQHMGVFDLFESLFDDFRIQFVIFLKCGIWNLLSELITGHESGAQSLIGFVDRRASSCGF